MTVLRRDGIGIRLGRRTAATALAVACALALAACASAPPPPPASAGQPVDMTQPAAVMATPLTTVSGARTSLAALKGKVLVVSDFMSLCQESCPLDTANVVAAAEAVEKAGLGDKVAFLSITIDPTRDTLPQLAAFRKLYGVAPADWYLATGTPTGLKNLWAALGVDIEKEPDTPPLPKNWRTGQPLTYDLTHSDDVFLFDARGHERFVLDGVPHVAAGAPIPQTIRNFMDAEGRANLANPGEDPWTENDELAAISWLAGTKVSA